MLANLALASVMQDIGLALHPPFRVTEQDVLIRHILAWRKALREGQRPPDPGDITHAHMRL